MAKKTTTVHEQESDLNLKREAFFQYHTKNQALFSNATRSYAEAFGWNCYPRAAGEGRPPSQKLSFRLLRPSRPPMKWYAGPESISINYIAN